MKVASKVSDIFNAGMYTLVNRKHCILNVCKPPVETVIVDFTTQNNIARHMGTKQYFTVNELKKYMRDNLEKYHDITFLQNKNLVQTVTRDDFVIRGILNELKVIQYADLFNNYVTVDDELITSELVNAQNGKWFKIKSKADKQDFAIMVPKAMRGEIKNKYGYFENYNETGLVHNYGDFIVIESEDSNSIDYTKMHVENSTAFIAMHSVCGLEKFYDKAIYERLRAMNSKVKYSWNLSE